jgi:hypothetical protein
MFGPKKKKIQPKTVEDYLKGEDVPAPTPDAEITASQAAPRKIRPYTAQAFVTLFILALMLVAFFQLSMLRSQVAELRAGGDGDARALRIEVAELAATLKTSDKQVSSLSDRVSTLQRELETEKSRRAKAEAVAVARRAAIPDKKAPKTTH